jgi:Trichohyalin-plectin-homology domain
MSAALVEKNHQYQCSLDSQRRDLRAYADENAKLISVAGRLSKVDVSRRQAEQQTCINEQQYQDRINDERGSRIRTQRVNNQNQDIVSELNREASEEERRGQQMQRICEESEELRELESALKIAYLNKERAAQYEEKIHRSAREQERIDEIEDQMEYDRQRAIYADAEKLEAQKGKFTEQRFVLQRQMREKEDQLIEARKQVEIERHMVDNIVNQINQEDENDHRKRKETQAATAQMVREFEERRHHELASAKRAAKEEEDAMIAYNKSVMARSEGVAAKLQARKNEEDRLLKRNLEEVAHKRREDEEFNDLRDMLWEEELEEKRANDQRAKLDRQAEMKRDMMNANSHLLASKAEMRQQEMEHESRIVQNMRRKFAEDEQREREIEERRRQDKIQHKGYIERQRADKLSMHDEERAREFERSSEEARKEEFRKKVIQEARRKLLEEHASKLQGYLPGKVFKNTDEYEGYQRQQGASRGYSR